MPFKLRLRKNRHQYNVVSKSLFVVGVELLDSTSVECTLATESLGSECLDNICQKLSFQQPEFFGLRYVSRNGAPRWVELDRPLKRQLDKHSIKYTLYLRIMYYVSGINLLTDEMIRYHYFLQLKSDVIEGRIKCNTEQAILLASYSMQAEFGNHDVEKHTPEYLKEFVLFPKHIINGHQGELTEAVICQHAALAGLPQGTAEEYYILAAQQLEGYGQETFTAKDGSSNEVLIGISLTGITVRSDVSRSAKFYKWRDITNVVNHKRYFGIECQIPEETVHYQFADVESAKYVWRMCVHQHTFFAQNGQSADQGNAAEIVRALLSRNTPDELHLNSSHEEIDGDYKMDEQVSNRNMKMIEENSNMGWERQKAQSTSCLDLSSAHPEIDRLRALLPGYRQAPDYETAIQKKYHNHRNEIGNVIPNPVLYSSHPDIHSAAHLQQHNHIYKHYPDGAHIDRLYRSEHVPVPRVDPAIHTYSTPELDTVTNNLIQGMQMMHLYKPPPPYPINRPSSNSTPDLASQTFAHPSHYIISSQVSGSSPDLVSSRSPYNLPYTDYRNSQYSNMLPSGEAHRTYADLATLDPQQRINDLKAKLVPASLYMKRQNGGVFSPAPVTPYMVGSNPYNGVGNISEPIYENVPLPWPPPSQQQHSIDTSNNISGLGSSSNGIAVGLSASGGESASMVESRSRASSIQSAPEMSTVTITTTTASSSNGPSMTTDRNNVTNVTITSAASATIDEMKVSVSGTGSSIGSGDANKSISFSNPSSTSSSSRLTSANHSVNTSFDSSHFDSNQSGTLNKDRGAGQKGRRKWGGILGGTKHKHGNRRDDAMVNGVRAGAGLHDTLPKHPLPTTISKEAMCQLLERKLEDSQLIFEFEKIPRFKSNADFTTAHLPENNNRNRHKDILPYEENRVRLSPTKENKHGYINASNITASVGNEQKFYIAAQSPLPSTVGHFWQMIWETDVYLVVNLGDLNDSNTVPYYHSTLTDKPFESGEFQIWSQFSQETGHCITTKLRVFHSSSRRVRGIWHLQYTEWVNDGCPKDVAHFLGFFEELSSVRQHTITEIPSQHNRNPPVLVHCCTGIGRTAVTILSDLLLYTLDHNQELDIARVVLLMRHQRMLMIETVTQYRFVYSLLACHLKNSRLI
ncbi:tyrosine-protein phosphatase non-receptor type 14-like isoform X1 [Planococcus citri]|uniref:tyrosine-protein phosphatase non-receptor type 14-like isoform X1 n=1 Tax=Planococcus citri TaxID=170843 RepID=UPI0031F8D69A